MPSRSRKRGRRTRPPTPAPRRPPTSSAATPASGPAAKSRSEERNAAVRATLTPLAPGERPWPLLVAVGLAVLVAIGDIVQIAVGGSVKFGSTHTSIGGVTLFSVVMLVCAVGMWRQRYWAVLGFQALLALVVLSFTLVLITANDVLRFVIALAVIAGGGFLFYKLVRVLSRMQMPRPGGADRAG